MIGTNRTHQVSSSTVSNHTVDPAPPTADDSAGRPTYRARFLPPASLSEHELRGWAALEERALESNAYLSPYFTLPALQHLDPDLPARIVMVKRRSAGPGSVREVAGVAVVSRRLRSHVMPLPHLEVYVSRHSYLGAPLLDRDGAREVATCLLDELARQAPLCAGLVIRNLDADGELLATLRDIVQTKGRMLGRVGAQQRAVLVPAQAGADSLKRTLRKKANEIERCRRRISESGDLQWHVHREAVGDEVIESFLRLEHGGWKADIGASLRSNPADEAFFRDMARRFAAAGRAFFTELRLDGQPIASTSNFVSGGAGFAFKVGWDDTFRKHGVGILNEAELVRHAPAVCADLRWIDSGAAPHSFIATLWPQRRTLVNVFVPLHGWGDVAWRLVSRLRAWRHPAVQTSPGTSASEAAMPPTPNAGSDTVGHQG